jgi:hypothetical protein
LRLIRGLLVNTWMISSMETPWHVACSVFGVPVQVHLLDPHRPPGGTEMREVIHFHFNGMREDGDPIPGHDTYRDDWRGVTGVSQPVGQARTPAT